MLRNLWRRLFGRSPRRPSRRSATPPPLRSWLNGLSLENRVMPALSFTLAAGIYTVEISDPAEVATFKLVGTNIKVYDKLNNLKDTQVATGVNRIVVLSKDGKSDQIAKFENSFTLSNGLKVSGIDEAKFNAPQTAISDIVISTKEGFTLTAGNHLQTTTNGISIEVATGDIALSANLTAGGQNIALKATTGVITQNAGVITADSLYAEAQNAITLNKANVVNQFAAQGNSSLWFVNNAALTIGQAKDTAGVSVDGVTVAGEAKIDVTTGSLTLTKNVSSTTRVAMRAKVDINQTTGVITSPELSAIALNGSISLVTGPNAVGTFAAKAANGKIEYVGDSSIDLTVGTVNDVTGAALNGAVANGLIDIRSGKALTVTQAITSTTGDVVLKANNGDASIGANLTGATITITATGKIDQTAGAATASVALGLESTVAGKILFTQANSTPIFAAKTVSGKIYFKNTTALDIGTVGSLIGVSAGDVNRLVEIETTAGGITVSQPITADGSITLKAAAGITINNTVGDATTDGVILYAQGGDVTVNQMVTTNTTNGFIAMRASGNVSQVATGVLTAVKTAAEAITGNITLDAVANAVDEFAAQAKGFVYFRSGNVLTIGEANDVDSVLLNGITAGNGIKVTGAQSITLTKNLVSIGKNIALNAGTSLSQNAGSIQATSLAAEAGTFISLYQSNSVDQFAASAANGGVAFQNNIALSVGTATNVAGVGIDGITATDFSKVLVTTGDLTLTQNLNVGATKGLALKATVGKIDQTGGVITADQLAAQAATGVDLYQTNLVNVFSATTTSGAVAFQNGQNLTIGVTVDVDGNSLNQISGTADSKIHVTVGSLDINAPVNVGTANLALKAVGNISQTQAITAGPLSAESTTGDITLINAANNVTQFAALSLAGSTKFVNSAALLVGTANDVNNNPINGITADNFVDVRTKFAGTLTITQAIQSTNAKVALEAADQLQIQNSVTAKTDIALQAVNGISQTAGGSLTAANLCAVNTGTGSNLNIALTTAANAISQFAALNASPGGVIQLRSTQNLTVGAVNDVNGTLVVGIVSNNGDINLAVNPGKTITVNQPVLAGSASATFTADDLIINNTVLAGTIQIAPATSGKNVGLGTAAGDITLTQAEINQLQASVLLRIGDPSSTTTINDITVGGTVTVLAAQALSLFAATGKIDTVAAGDGFQLKALTLHANTGIGVSNPLTLTPSSGTINVAFQNDSAGPVRITQTTGELKITLSGTDTAILPGLQIFNNAPGASTELTSGNTITFDANVTSQGNLTATTTPDNAGDQNITVNASKTLLSTSGAVTLDAADSVLLSANTLVQATSGAVTLKAGTGDIDGKGAITMDPTTNLIAGTSIQLDALQQVQFGALTAPTSVEICSKTADIVQVGGIITSAKFGAIANTGIGTTTQPILTNVDQFAAVTNTGGIFLTEANGLSITKFKVCGIDVTGVTTNVSGDIRIVLNAGALDMIGIGISSVQTLGAGNITLDVSTGTTISLGKNNIINAATGKVFLHAGPAPTDVVSLDPASLGIQAGGGLVQIKANDMKLLAPVQAPGGAIRLMQAGTTTQKISIGTGEVGTLGLDAAEISNLNANTLCIGRTDNAGDIRITGTSSFPGTMILYTGGSITTISGGVNVPFLGVEAAGNVVLDGTNNIGTIAGKTTGGSLFSVKSGIPMVLNTVVSCDGTPFVGITAVNGTVVLEAPTIAQLPANLVTAQALCLMGPGDFFFGEPNQVTTLAAKIGGNLTFVNAKDLVVGTVGTCVGITSTGGGATLTVQGPGTTITVADAIGVLGQATLNAPSQIFVNDAVVGGGIVFNAPTTTINTAKTLLAKTTDVLLLGKVLLTAPGAAFVTSNNGQIVFFSTVDSPGSTTGLKTTSGKETIFQVPVGATGPLANYDGSISGPGSIVVQGGLFQTTGTQNFNGTVNALSANTNFVSTANADISFNAALFSPGTVNVLTGGTTFFNNTVSVGNLTTNAGGATVFINAAASVTATGTLNLEDPVLIQTDTTFTANNVFFGSSVVGPKSLTVVVGTQLAKVGTAASDPSKVTVDTTGLTFNLGSGSLTIQANAASSNREQLFQLTGVHQGNNLTFAAANGGTSVFQIAGDFNATNKAWFKPGVGSLTKVNVTSNNITIGSMLVGITDDVNASPLTQTLQGPGEYKSETSGYKSQGPGRAVVLFVGGNADDVFNMRPDLDVDIRVFGRDPSLGNIAAGQQGDRLNLDLTGFNIVSAKGNSQTGQTVVFADPNDKTRTTIFYFQEIEDFTQGLRATVVFSYKTTPDGADTFVAIGGFGLPPLTVPAAAPGVLLAPEFTNPNGQVNVSRILVVPSLNGQGVVITGGGPGQAPVLNIYDGNQLLNEGKFVPIFSTMVFEESFRGGIFIAAGDLDGNGTTEIVVSADQGGGPRVRIFNFDSKLNQLVPWGPAPDFFVYDINLRGGVRIAASDFNGDGKAELVTGAGVGGGPHVRVLELWKLDSPLPVGAFPPSSVVATEFFAYDVNYRGGVWVSAGNLINFQGETQRLPELITAPGGGGGPHIKVWKMHQSGAIFAALAYEFMSIAQDDKVAESVFQEDQTIPLPVNRASNVFTPFASDSALTNQLGVWSIGTGNIGAGDRLFEQGRRYLLVGSGLGETTQLRVYRFEGDTIGALSVFLDNDEVRKSNDALKRSFDDADKKPTQFTFPIFNGGLSVSTTV